MNLNLYHFMDYAVNLLPESPTGSDFEKSINDRLQEIHALIDRRQAPEDSILTGNLGLVIYHYCISLLNDQYADSRAIATDLIEQILSNLSSAESTLKSYQYSSGLSGLGSVLQFLIDEEVIDIDLDEDFQVIDESIYEHALEQIDNGYVEFMHGGAGALYYFNMRHPSGRITHYKEQLVSAILNQAKKDPLGLRIPRSRFLWTENDDYDLSLSHGLCGVMHIMLSVLETGSLNNEGQINTYLQDATSFIVNLKREIHKETGNHSFFPSYLKIDSTHEQISRFDYWPDSRLAWCYGDIGWVLYFYRFGRFTNNPELLNLAEEIGIATTSRKTLQETYSSTSHFCHGHTGLAYTYKHLYQVSGRPEYDVAGKFWLQQTLHALKEELTNGFYKQKSLETSFLEGLAGVNLVLASFLTNKDLKWQKFLLFR